MTLISERSFLDLVSTHQPFIVFSLSCPALGGRGWCDRAAWWALGVSQCQATTHTLCWISSSLELPNHSEEQDTKFPLLSEQVMGRIFKTILKTATHASRPDRPRYLQLRNKMRLQVRRKTQCTPFMPDFCMILEDNNWTCELKIKCLRFKQWVRWHEMGAGTCFMSVIFHVYSEKLLLLAFWYFYLCSCAYGFMAIETAKKTSLLLWNLLFRCFNLLFFSPTPPMLLCCSFLWSEALKIGSRGFFIDFFFFLVQYYFREDQKNPTFFYYALNVQNGWVRFLLGKSCFLIWVLEQAQPLLTANGGGGTDGV